MNHLSLSELDDSLLATIRRVAERDGLSENQAAIELLQRGAALEDEPPENGKVGNSLDDFIGGMDPEEAAKIDEAVRELREFDKSSWR